MTTPKLKRVTDRRFDRFKPTEVDAVIRELRTAIAAAEAETRRHMDVVAEAIHDDIMRYAQRLGIPRNRLNEHKRNHDARAGARSSLTWKR